MYEFDQVHYYRFPINMVFAAYLLENAIISGPGVGHAFACICNLPLSPTVGFLFECPVPMQLLQNKMTMPWGGWACLELTEP